MGAVAKAVGEAVVLVIVAFVVAAGVNDLRPKGRLDWSTDYFRHAAGRQSRQPAESTSAAEPVARAGGEDSTASTAQHPEHGYQVISFEEVVEVFNDPATEARVNLFVDARGDDAYKAGHIPGALQCNHYRLAEYIQDVLEYAYGAQKIIVYCNGGDCEDSIFVCGDLEEFDVPYDSLYLYTGGWQEWSSKDQPVELGSVE